MSRIYNFLSEHIHTLGFLGVTLIILGSMLAPGYILTLDMVWADDLTRAWNADGFNNIAPLFLVFSGLSLLLPSWVVQKLLLIGIFFLLLFLPYRFLPLIQTKQGRWFAALLYTLNPFVYGRLLAGQWGVLLGYACLPLVLYTLHQLLTKRDVPAGIRYGLALGLTGVFSVHFLYLSIILSVIWFGAHLGRNLCFDRTKINLSQVRATIAAVVVFLIVSSYWLIPAISRETPLETRFDETHFIGFAASENHLTPTLLNLAVLGGFWAEGDEWRYYFLWPQDEPIFWLAATGILALIISGFLTLVRNQQHRFVALLLLVIGVCAYITALGAWGGIFSSTNLWLYEHVPGWSGLRDSHKIAGVLALVYAVFAGAGIDKLTMLTRKNAGFARLLMPIVFILPLIFGMYQLFGFRGQLSPTEYPSTWYETREIMSGASKGEKMLVLPWQGYFSLPFNNQLLVANPTPRFFGSDRVISGRSVGVEDIYDQEIDPEYRKVDDFLHQAATLPPEVIEDFLRSQNIKYLFVVVNEAVVDQNTWLLAPRVGSDLNQTAELSTVKPQESVIVQALLQAPHEKIIDSNVILYRFSTNEGN